MKYEWSNTLEEFLLRLQPAQQTCHGLNGAEAILLQMHLRSGPEQGADSEERKAA
ncbi:hypothetical protein GCM10028895_26300 [Pontibacter rugosus]